MTQGSSPTRLGDDGAMTTLMVRVAEARSRAIALCDQLESARNALKLEAERTQASVLRSRARSIREDRLSYRGMLEELQQTVTQLEHALVSRAIIEQAKGVLIARQRCDAEKAFDILRRASQRENRKLHQIAVEIVEHAQQRPAPPPSA